MKRYLCLMLPVLVLVVAGCNKSKGYWISGPWTGAKSIKDKFDDKIKIGMLRADLEDKLGKPTDVIPETGEGDKVAEGSKAAWLLYKYDYPDNPILLTIKVDYFGIVTDKYYDDKETIAKMANEGQVKEDETNYPGAPQKRFQDLLKKKRDRVSQ